jgi:hypothetical protein
MWGVPPDAHVDYELWRSRIHPDDLARVDTSVAARRARQGGRLKINATVDAEGIAHLKEVLHKYEEILKLLWKRGRQLRRPLM